MSALKKYDLNNSLSRQTDQVTKNLPVEFNYHLLRNALNDFSKNIAQLNDDEYKRVFHKAGKSFELESLVMASPEAEGIVISPVQLDQAVAEVASRYDETEFFVQDLENNGLDEASLRKALYRELLFDSVMQRVSANSLVVNDIDVHLFYEMHRERFETPELRTARHILITVNPDYPENTEEAALERMQQLVEKLNGRSNRFKQFSKQYSECPTAMEGGKLGEVQRGQLYPELDSILFKMEENQISPIVQSEMGFHVLFCEKIKPSKKIPLSKVKQRIHDSLQERHQRNCQKHWITDLKKKLQIQKLGQEQGESHGNA